MLANKRHLLTSRTLGEYEELLDQHGFARTRKSHLVNQIFVSFLDHDGFVVLRDGTWVEVSRRRKEEVGKWLKAG